MTNSEDMSTSENLSVLTVNASEVNGNIGDILYSNVTGFSVLQPVATAAASSLQNSLSVNSYTGSDKSNRKKSVCSTLGDSTEAPNGSTYAIPFVNIRGEKVLQVIPTSDGILVITNYRLYIQGKENHSNIPLGLVDQVECRDIFFLHINCKDARCIRCTFPNNETVVEAVRKLQQTLLFAKNLDEYFAFTFYDKVETRQNELSEEVKLQLGSDLPLSPSPKERFEAEVRRMEFNVQNPWRISYENEDYELCTSYPRHIIVPNSIDKKKLEQVACFRSARRFPAVVWRHRGNGAVICRCSQPEVGWFGWRSTEDEELVQNIIQACAYDRWPQNGEMQSVPLESMSSPTSYGGPIELVPELANPVKKLLILDARSYTTAVANRARGGGCECLEYYPNCEIQFMNLANIHSIRKSFSNVRQLCALPSDQANWFSQLESCKWLQHMSGLMKAAVTVVTAIEQDGRPVMVHCSDGWDRTPQIVALAEILLDPYYRSLEGFEILVEREWLDFGHKFGDRCGQGVGSEDGNERCPVFLQWLDCLHQLLRQFPTAFEFNMSFLVKLVQHTYSNLFGTFLCNTSKEREQHEISRRTISVWRFLRAPRNYDKFRNSLYKSCDKVLWPSCEVRDLGLWPQVYLGYENPPPSLTAVVNPSQESSPAPSVAEGEALDGSYKSLASKGRSSSYENLTQLHPSTKGHQRKLSDSSIYGPQDNDTEGMKDILAKTPRDGESEAVNNGTEDIDSPLNGCPDPNPGDCENSENDEDTEPSSEGRSESTLICTPKIKLNSIESSTDTLVAEFGFCADSKMGLTNGEVKTKMNSVEETAKPCKDPGPKVEHLRGNDDALSDIEFSLLSDNLSSLAVEIGGHHLLDGPTSEKLMLPEDIDDLNHYTGNDNLPGHHHCTVCEQSKAVLQHVRHDSVPVSNGLGNPPSTSSSGSGTISYTSSLNGGIGSGLTSVTNFLLKERQSFDVDGLTYYHDETQIRLSTILSECQAHIEALQRDVQIYRNALREQVCHRCPPPAHSVTDVVVPDDTVSMTGSEVISHSSEASSSFETIDHADTYPPLWVPDFAVRNCTDCFLKFSLGRRKHHCRACGRVFCSDCSENSIALPHEQIFVPTRVCRSCFCKHRNNSNHSISTEIMTNDGDAPSVASSSAVSRPVSVPYTNNTQQIAEFNGHHISNGISSTKFAGPPPLFYQMPQVHASSHMNGGVHQGGKPH